MDGGLQIPTPGGSLGGHSPDFGSDAARQFMANGLMASSNSPYGQPGAYGNALMGMPVNTNLGLQSGSVSPGEAAAAYGMPGYFPMMVRFVYGAPESELTHTATIRIRLPQPYDW